MASAGISNRTENVELSAKKSAPFYEIILHSSMARKASSGYLDFFRLDFPEIDPSEWHQWITVKREDGTVKTGELPINFWGPLKENYEKHR